jgi:hypothetical protein
MSIMRRSFALSMPILAWFAVASLQGSPITYDFNGRLDSPVDGATTFSGSFTYSTNLPLVPNAHQASNITYYGDDPTTPGKLISVSFSFGNVNSRNLGSISNTELSVWHDQTYDMIQIDAAFTKNGNTSHFTMAMLNDNRISPGQFTSTAPPSSLDLALFNQGNDIRFDPTIPITGPAVFGTITGLVPAGTPLPPVPPAPSVPEPATLTVIVAGFGCLFLRKANSRKSKRQ